MFGRKKKNERRHAAAKRTGPPTTRAVVSESGGLEPQQPLPDHPLQERDVPRLSAFFVLKRTVREFVDDQATDLAAALTYYSVLAIFPGLIALFSLVGVFGAGGQAVDKTYQVLAPFVAPEVLLPLRTTIEGLAEAPGAGVGLVVGLLGALWSASGYVGAFSRAMNRVLEVEEGRPFWRMRPMQLVVTIVTVLLCAVALVILIVSGPVTETVGRVLGAGDNVQLAWGIAKWPVLAVVVMAVVALLYWATPNVRLPKFRIISVGAFVAIAVWLLASVGFAFYVGNFGSYNKTYGVVAGVVVALVWLWLTNVALLFGAELDAELERGRELRRGMAAEVSLQLPVRDRAGIDKAGKRRQEDVEKQRELRLVAAGGGDPADRPFAKT